MTAKMSPTMSIGSKTPVEDLPPKIRAIRITTKMAIPFMPDFESPTMKAANSASAQLVQLKSKGNPI